MTVSSGTSAPGDPPETPCVSGRHTHAHLTRPAEGCGACDVAEECERARGRAGSCARGRVRTACGRALMEISSVRLRWYSCRVFPMSKRVSIDSAGVSSYFSRSTQVHGLTISELPDYSGDTDRRGLNGWRVGPRRICRYAQALQLGSSRSPSDSQASSNRPSCVYGLRSVCCVEGGVSSHVPHQRHRDESQVWIQTRVLLVGPRSGARSGGRSRLGPGVGRARRNSLRLPRSEYYRPSGKALPLQSPEA
jgi:hypothetical protein